jgi:phosphoenolpyruvate carboxylase
MAHAPGRIRQSSISSAQLRSFFATALVNPVLTAHPTEVRRKSFVDREMEVAQLLADRDRVAEVQQQYGKEAVPNYVISKTDGHMVDPERTSP